MSMDFLTSETNVLQVWTDGAINIHSKKLPGGWSSVFVYKKMLIDSQWAGVAPTTSQRMELTAALEGLKTIYEVYVLGSKQNDQLLKLKPDINEIQILSDSSYLITCMVAMWYMNWRINNWISLVDNSEVKNRDLWEQILYYKEQLEEAGYKLVWRKVKGHKGLMYNELADRLAVKGKFSVS